MLHKKGSCFGSCFFYHADMRKKTLFVLLLDVAMVAVAFGAGVVTDWMMGSLPACPVAELGFLCPACGGTRCVRYLFSGQLAAAFAVNPFFFALAWYLFGALLLLNIGVLLKVRWAERTAIRMTDWRAVIVAAVCFTVFGILRNFV